MAEITENFEFFERAEAVAKERNWLYAIELCLEGLRIIPDHLPGHELLRQISLQAKADGTRPLPILASIKLYAKSRTDLDRMLAAEKRLSYDPGNSTHMIDFLNSAKGAGCHRAAAWMEHILRTAYENSGSGA
jgi:hypothetical protein